MKTDVSYLPPHRVLYKAKSIFHQTLDPIEKLISSGGNPSEEDIQHLDRVAQQLHFAVADSRDYRDIGAKKLEREMQTYVNVM